MAFDVDGNTVGVVAMAIPVVGSIALFSFLSVAAWSDARRIISSGDMVTRRAGPWLKASAKEEHSAAAEP